MKRPPLALSGKLVAGVCCLSLAYALLAGAMPWTAAGVFFAACCCGAAAVRR